MENNKIRDMQKINKTRCILSFVLCVGLCVAIFLAVSDQLLRQHDPVNNVTSGFKTCRTFTVMSNIFMVIAAAMCIPYTVDGLRYHNYHLPRWCVDLLYTAVTCMALTFAVAFFVLSPLTSFSRMMFTFSNVLFHTICPILAVILFLFINTDHEVSLRSNLIAMCPLFLYSLPLFFHGLCIERRGRRLDRSLSDLSTGFLYAASFICHPFVSCDFCHRIFTALLSQADPQITEEGIYGLLSGNDVPQIPGYPFRNQCTRLC